MAESLGGGVPRNVTRLGGGLSCATHRFDLGGQRLVVKRAKPGEQGVVVEFTNLQYAMRSRAPTPEPIACDADGEWFGTAAIVMTALPGEPQLFPADVARWTEELARALVQLHDTSVPDFEPRRAPRWQRWKPWEDDPDERLQAIAEVVRGLGEIAPGGVACFTHDDYHPGNVVFVDDRLSGVVDWAFVTLEPRESAVAYCRKDLAIFPGGDAPDLFLGAYEAELGARLEHLDYWEVLHGAGAMKWGHLWPPSFQEMGADIDADHVYRRSVEFVDAALRRLGANG